jgi:hypothetical protein
VAQIYLAPYCTSALNITQSTSLLANTLTLFVGLMLIIDISLEEEAKLTGENFDTFSRNVIAILIVVVNLAVLAVPPTITALQSGIFSKVLRFFNKKAEKLEIEDTESNDADLEQTVDNSPLLPLPTSLTLTADENVSSSCSIPESLMTWDLVFPVRKLESNKELQSYNEATVHAPDYLEAIKHKTSLRNLIQMPIAENSSIHPLIDNDTVFSQKGVVHLAHHAGLKDGDSSKSFNYISTLCFALFPGRSIEDERQTVSVVSDSGSVIQYAEENVPIDTTRDLLHMSVTNPTGNTINLVTTHSYLEVEAGATMVHSQTPVSGLQSDKEEQVAAQHITSAVLRPEIALQQASNDTIRLVAEGLAEFQEIPGSGGQFF